MKNIFPYLVTIVLLFTLTPHGSTMAQGISSEGESESGAVVCAPDVYYDSPGDCLPAGPSSYLTEMAKLGLTFPQRALPIFKPDAELTKLPYFYFRLDEDVVPVLSGPGGDSTGTTSSSNLK